MRMKLLSDIRHLDPDGHGRIKGLRLVAAYGMAVVLGGLHALTIPQMPPAILAFMAGAYALWASVSEARDRLLPSCRDLIVLCISAGLGALFYIGVSPPLLRFSPSGAEFVLAAGQGGDAAFAAGPIARGGVEQGLDEAAGAQGFGDLFFRLGIGRHVFDGREAVARGGGEAVEEAELLVKETEVGGEFHVVASAVKRVRCIMRLWRGSGLGTAEMRLCV